ncbi:MAG: hypothetical protein E6I62_02760 [Chloroflexi bacterium]|nr:MAG: hypothetical protein E6I62_02760 [Chloroflexota bacterium]
MPPSATSRAATRGPSASRSANRPPTPPAPPARRRRRAVRRSRMHGASRPVAIWRSSTGWRTAPGGRGPIWPWAGAGWLGTVRTRASQHQPTQGRAIRAARHTERHQSPNHAGGHRQRRASARHGRRSDPCHRWQRLRVADQCQARVGRARSGWPFDTCRPDRRRARWPDGQKGYPTHSYQRTIDQWWASPGHHAIMVGDYNVAGGSWSVSSSGGTYSVMVFVKTCAPTSTGPVGNPPPTVTWRSPASGATGVSPATAVSARFSEAVSGVSASTFVLRDAVTGTILSAAVTYDATAKQATLRPTHWLGLGHSYRVSLSSSIRDTGGASLAFTSWTFKTATVQAFSPTRTVSFGSGKHVGYRFASNGTVLASKPYTLARASSASGSRRALIAGHSGTWYLISNGVWAGYWVQASSSVVLH